MHHLLLIKEKNTYLITENTSERLFVLAELLLNSSATDLAETLLNNPAQHSAHKAPFVLEQAEGIITIKLYHAHEAITKPGKPLTVEIPSQDLAALLAQWRSVIAQHPHSIKLVEEKDAVFVQIP